MLLSSPKDITLVMRINCVFKMVILRDGGVCNESLDLKKKIGLSIHRLEHFFVANDLQKQVNATDRCSPEDLQTHVQFSDAKETCRNVLR